MNYCHSGLEFILMTGRTIVLALTFKLIMDFYQPKTAAVIRFRLAGVVQLFTYGLIVLMFESYSENSFKEFAKLSILKNRIQIQLKSRKNF